MARLWTETNADINKQHFMNERTDPLENWPRHQSNDIEISYFSYTPEYYAHSRIPI